MLNLKRFLLSALIGTLCVLNSCAPKPKQAKATLKITPSLAIANINMDGGAVVYGQQLDGPGSWGKVFRPGDDVVVDMAFGVWNFSVFAYAGPAPLSGTKECALLNQINIEKENEVIDMVVAPGNCQDAGLRRINIKRCTEAQYNSADPLTNCNQTTGFESYRMALLAHRLGSPTGERIVTDCIKDSAGNFNGTGRPFLPTGATSVRVMPFEIITYPGANCEAGGEQRFSVDSLNRPTDGAIFKTALEPLDLFVIVNNTRFPLTRNISSVTPTSGGVAGGYNLVINGLNLDPGGTVTVGGNACTITAATTTSITCTAPAGTLGLADIIHTTGGGDTASLLSGFTYASAPTITSVSPNISSTTGGSLITISGTNFQAGATVTANGVACTSPTVTSTTITCTVGASTASTGNVIVTNPDSQSGTSPGSFYYEDAPTVASLDITNGPEVGGTLITVTGANFASGATITVNGVTCTSPTVLSATSATCTTPAQTAGTYDLTFTNPGGSTTTLTSAFTYNPAPTFSSITPTAGITTGGTSVTINGTSFQAGATITINGVTCTTPTITATTITCTTGVSAAGASDVIVTNPDGQSVTAISVFTYQNPANITITGSTDFGDVTVGNANTTILTLTNSGDVQATAISDNPLSGSFAYSGAFPGSGGTCTATLNAGTSCDISITFSPGTPGADSSSVIINYHNGATGTSASNVVTGNGLSPALLVINAGADIDYQVVSSYPTDPITNNGAYNAATNTPALFDGTGGVGEFYTASNDGKQDFGSGFVKIKLGDIILYDGARWVVRKPVTKKVFNVQNTGGTQATAVTPSVSTPFRFTGGTYPGSGGNCTFTMNPGTTCTIELEVMATQVAKWSQNFQLNYNNGAGGTSSSVLLNAKTGRIVKISGFSESACALFDSGQVKCWGANTNGELGYEDTTTRGTTIGTIGSNLPFVNLGTGVLATDITSGKFHNCVITTTRRMKCWGRNIEGQLGYGDTVGRGGGASTMGDNLPFVDFGRSGSEIVRIISGGGNHTCAVLDAPTGGAPEFRDLFCWGLNNNGQLGVGDTTNYNSPVVVNTGAAARVGLSLGLNHTCVEQDGIGLRCWGHGLYGQLGSDNFVIQTNAGGIADVDLNGLSLPIKPYIGGNHSCGIGSTGSIKCWGQNNAGQLGYEDATDKGKTGGDMAGLPVVPVPAGSYVKLSATASSQTCALNGSGEIICWGAGATGNLGNGGVANIGDNAGEITGLTPIDLGTGLFAVDLSATQTCAILNNGQAKCWGFNGSGQLGIGTNANMGDTPAEMGDGLPYLNIH